MRRGLPIKMTIATVVFAVLCSGAVVVSKTDHRLPAPEYGPASYYAAHDATSGTAARSLVRDLEHGLAGFLQEQIVRQGGAAALMDRGKLRFQERAIVRAVMPRAQVERFRAAADGTLAEQQAWIDNESSRPAPAPGCRNGPGACHRHGKVPGRKVCRRYCELRHTGGGRVGNGPGDGRNRHSDQHRGNH